MSLLTVERSTPSVDSPADTDEECEVLSANSSSFEGFVTTKNFAICLPHRQWTQVTRGDPLHIHHHLQKLVKMMRPCDTLRLCVELEKGSPTIRRYLVVVTTQGQQDTEEALLLGTEMHRQSVSIGLVLPIWRDTEIRLDGDGGFIVKTGDRHHIFKTTSVQSMWTVLQCIYRQVEKALQHNYYVHGLSHTWTGWYHQHLTQDRQTLSEWNKTEDISISFPEAHVLTRRDSLAIQRHVAGRLREIMLHVDLEEVSSKQIRQHLEEDMEMDLNEFRSFIDQTIMLILGQMEKPSMIKDYLYLGSEWNAANIDELKDIGIGFILNCTREIDNFFPDVLKYKNIRVYDKDESELMRHWDETYRFIEEARSVGSKVLVHCKMGISRSAATTMAYLMKEYTMSYKQANEFVKCRRSCVNPNPGFVSQLRSYEGILNARHNPMWGTKASRRLRRHQRSMSDPDLKKIALLSTSCLIPPSLIAHFDMGSTPNIEKSGDPGSGAEAVDASSSARLKPSSGLGRSISSPQCIREAKDQHIRSFLATMALEEEDQGIMENTASDSTSNFSSPLSLTPPDVEGVLTTIRQTMAAVRESNAKQDCNHKEEDNEQEEIGKHGYKEEDSEAVQDMDESDEKGLQEEDANVMPVGLDRRRNSDLPLFSPKVHSKPEDAFFAGKRASVAEVLICIQNADSEKVVSTEESLEGVWEVAEQAHFSEELEENGEMIDRAVKARRVSQSQSFPEELNAIEGQEEEKEDVHLTARQHRRSRSELQMNEIATEMENKEDTSLPITAPQIESVRERVKKMEKQAVGSSSSTLGEPAVGNWYKRVYSAPSLHSVSSSVCSTPPLDPVASISRPSSRTSNWEEIAEETEEEAVTFTASDEEESSLPASPASEQAMECDALEEILCEDSNEEPTVSHGQATEQVLVDEKRPTPSTVLRWEPLHSRSQSNVEPSSVKALIKTLEKRTKPLHASMQSLVRTDDSHKCSEEGEEVMSQGDADQENRKETEEEFAKSSGRSLESTQRQGLEVKRTQSLSALYRSSEQVAALPCSHSVVKKHDSFPLVMVNGAPQLTIPEAESIDGLPVENEEPPAEPNNSGKGNLAEMDTLSASVLELTQKFEERKPKPPPQMKHSFSSSTSSTTVRTCSSRSTSDDERGSSASPCPTMSDPPSLKV